ncbi:MAG TPA: SDR family oxidoreductase [Streptosporangiaceae bacterium]|jgi:NAD(P)-dependent dehydrogenase (short-subunit alcohol dehydrogenase family)|nr:SDR family oxidoreductase [Streptosporangiaceae bacterium]
MAERTPANTLLVIGGTSGIGREIAARAVARGDEVVISGRELERAGAVAKELGAGVTPIALDIGKPHDIAGKLAGLANVDHLVLAAIERDANTVADYDVGRAIYLSTLKLVGYIETIHALLPKLSKNAAIVLFGGLAKDRPYPGSTTVSTINGGVSGMLRTLAVELAPIRVNAIHPGIVGDSPFWAAKPDHVLDGYRARTPGGELATMADVADAAEFLLRNNSVNGVDLNVDGGWIHT